MRELVRDRRFVLLWLGQAVNTVGHGLTIVALAVLIVDTHGATTLGAVLATDSTAMAVTLLAGGVIADRYSRTAVMATSDVLRACAVLGYALAPDDAGLPLLALWAVLEGTGFALFQPAWRAALPQIVPAERLREVNALVQATNRGGMLVGAALGGVLVGTVGSRPALLIDALTYVVSLATLLVVRLPSVIEGPVAQGLAAAVGEVRDGVRAVLARPWVGVTMVQGTVQVLFAYGPMQVLLPVVATDRYAAGAYGLLMACGQAGMLAGSLVALRLKPRREGVTAMHGLAPTALVNLCIAVPVPLPVFCVAQFLAWAGTSLFIVLWFASLQRTFPSTIQGRVFSVEQLTTFALQPVALVLTPFAASWLGLRTVGVTAAAVLLVATYAVLVVPGVAAFRDPEPSGQESGEPDESQPSASSLA